MWNSNIENSELDFIYSDSDNHPNEMAELYSYTEEQDINSNRWAFEEIMEEHGFPLKFKDMSPDQQQRVIEILMDRMELTQESSRWKAIHGLLYLLQGTFGECDTIADHFSYARKYSYELYKHGLFPICVQLLQWEIESNHPDGHHQQTSGSSSQNKKSSTITIGDSVKLRTILSILYTFIEVMRIEHEDDTPEEIRLRCQLREELSQPFGSDLLAITLFQMTTKFCNGTSAHFPIKKVLLLLWKVILFSMGGIDTLKRLKGDYRSEAGLKPVPDDTHEVVKNMRPASPPINANEVLEAQNQRKMNRPFKRQMIVKQSSIGGEDQDNNSESNDVNEDDLMPDEGVGSDSDISSDNHNSRKSEDMEEKIDMGGSPASPRPGTPNPGSVNRSKDDGTGEDEHPSKNRGLPWVPKVRHRDIDAFFDTTRSKFVGFILPQDRTTTAGLPDPILEGIKILQNHVYISLTEIQVKREEDLIKYPLTFAESCDESHRNSPSEILYGSMLPSLSQYMIALLKILLAAAPTSRAKTESINIVSDVLPEEMPVSVLQSMKLGIDVNRHKEIIIKSVSAILFLLLKHYKINHVYQFEYISQQLMFANCIPLVLKFFNQNICQYVSARNSISVIDFPSCSIGEQPELTTENLEVCSETQIYCWRNLFSCINLLRILNKLTKWKHSRIMMLVVFKSAPILKRALKLRHAMLQLYVLKLLKMQAKYLGRQWRKSNMKTMSAIYQKVRHRITDDWAYGNDLDAKPWDFQAEEFALQANINRFHFRRYGRSSSGQPLNPSSAGGPLAANTSLLESLAESDLMQSVDTNFMSVLSKDFQLTSDFKNNYDTWLQREVYSTQIDWDLLLSSTNTCGDM